MSDERLNRREIAAVATRREILAAARRLFAANGYAGTSVQQIAAESGVAVQTIYSSVGAKSALVLALNDLIDEEAGIGPLAAELGNAKTPLQLLQRGVHITRVLNERCGDLIRVLLSTEPSEPDVAIAVADGLRRHEQGAHGIALALAARGALLAEVTPDRAAAVFAMMTSPASWQQLTRGSGWDFDEAEAWVVESLAKLLLARRR